MQKSIVSKNDQNTILICVKILFFNIVIAVLLLFLSDFLYYKAICYNEMKVCSKIHRNFQSPPYDSVLKSFDDVYAEIRNDKFRKPEGLNSKAKPIIIFGCSFAYGDGLNNSQTFSHKLFTQTSRPIYNRSFSAWGVQQMLYQLKREDFYKEVKKPEYIIFVIMSDHINRVYYHTFRSIDTIENLRYFNENGELKRSQQTTNIFNSFWMVKHFQKFIIDNFVSNKKNNDEKFDFLKMHLEESKKLSDEHFPGSKFVILKYCNDNSDWSLNTDRWKELEKEGFIVLDTKTLTRKDLSLKQYTLPDSHPNEKAWDVVTPALVKKLNL